MGDEDETTSILKRFRELNKDETTSILKRFRELNKDRLDEIALSVTTDEFEYTYSIEDLLISIEERLALKD